MGKITFRAVQKAVLAADDAKGTGFDVRANQSSASFSQMFKYLATKDADYLEACEKNPKLDKDKSPGIEFLSETLTKYVKEELRRRAKAEEPPNGFGEFRLLKGKRKGRKAKEGK